MTRVSRNISLFNCKHNCYLFIVVLTEIYVIKWLRITQQDDVTQIFKSANDSTFSVQKLNLDRTTCVSPTELPRLNKQPKVVLHKQSLRNKDQQDALYFLNLF
jgi:hypothetical protein